MKTKNKITEDDNDVQVADNETVTSAPQYISPLIDKKVKLTLIKKNTNKIATNLNEATMFTGTSTSLMLPISGTTGSFVNPFKDENDRIFLEHKLGLSLDPYKKGNSNYWNTLRVKFIKDDHDVERNYLELNLSDPYQYLQYLILKVHPEVAKSESEINSESRFILEDGNNIVKEKYEYETMFDDCNTFKLKLKGDKKALWDFFNVYQMIYKVNKKVSREQTPEGLYAEFGNLVRDKNEIKRVYDIIKKKEQDEAWYNIIILIKDAVEIGEIVSKNNVFETSTGTFLGQSIDDVTIFFKDIRNSALKASITSKTKVNFK